MAYDILAFNPQLKQLRMNFVFCIKDDDFCSYCGYLFANLIEIQKNYYLLFNMFDLLIMFRTCRILDINEFLLISINKTIGRDCKYIIIYLRILLMFRSEESTCLRKGLFFLY